MSKKKSDILLDANFRKTPKCAQYKSKLENKEFTKFPVKEISGSECTANYLFQNGWDEPMLFTSNLGLTLTVPPSTTSVSDIAAIVGTNVPVNIIEVGRQAEITGYTIGDYARYIEGRTPNHKIVNLISLEISATPLNSKVQSPSVVRAIDWINTLWPLDRRARGDFPRVQKYFLCGMGGSYTDFHLDFGGTSVWYHVIWGKKRFYLIRPTCANLLAYQTWACAPNQEELFLPDLIPEDDLCYYVDVLPGQTLLLPGGWIHAVYTPEDSLVFGGNFLHSSAIIRQLQVHVIEERTHVNKQYRFPYFFQMNWFMLVTLLPLLEAKWGLGRNSHSRTVKDTGEDDDDDEDDVDEDLLAFRDSMEIPAIFRQLPYLVRCFELWVCSSSCPFRPEDNAVILKSSQSAGYSGPVEVVERWWTVLKVMARDFDKNNGTTDDGSSSEESEEFSFQKHIENIKTIRAFDLLDETVIGEGFLNDVNKSKVVTTPSSTQSSNTAASVSTTIAATIATTATAAAATAVTGASIENSVAKPLQVPEQPVIAPSTVVLATASAATSAATAPILVLKKSCLEETVGTESSTVRTVSSSSSSGPLKLTLKLSSRMKESESKATEAAVNTNYDNNTNVASAESKGLNHVTVGDTTRVNQCDPTAKPPLRLRVPTKQAIIKEEINKKEERRMHQQQAKIALKEIENAAILPTVTRGRRIHPEILKYATDVDVSQCYDQYDSGAIGEVNDEYDNNFSFEENDADDDYYQSLEKGDQDDDDDEYLSEYDEEEGKKRNNNNKKRKAASSSVVSAIPAPKVTARNATIASPAKKSVKLTGRQMLMKKLKC